MADAALSRERAKNLQIRLVQPERDLLGARRMNLDIEILKILCELLDAMTRPELTFFSVASESWDPALSSTRCSHELPSLALSPPAIAPHLILVGHAGADAEAH
jgi:hypothetical protein